MRISSALSGALLLAGCGQARTDDSGAVASSEKIACARQGAAMTRDCTVERTQSKRGLILTLRHPDGAFHRLLVTKDGRGVIAADGAQKVTVSIMGAQGIEVALAGDRYQLPATVKGITAQP